MFISLVSRIRMVYLTKSERDTREVGSRLCLICRGRVGYRVQVEPPRDKHKTEKETERNWSDQMCTAGEATSSQESWAPSTTHPYPF